MLGRSFRSSSSNLRLSSSQSARTLVQQNARDQRHPFLNQKKYHNYRDEYRQKNQHESHQRFERKTINMFAEEADSLSDLKWTSLGLLTVSLFATYLLMDDINAEEEKNPEKELTLRQKLIGQYENRIRSLSSPEKIFEYFASVQLHGEYFMTPNDFLRSLKPYDYRPDTPVGAGSNALGSVGKVAELSKNDPVPAIFKLVDQNSDGLISFGEYIFFVTLLSIPEKDVRIAFKIFDINGDGEVDTEEFKKVMKVLRSESQFATAQRSQSSQVENAGLIPLFFGNDGKKKLQYQVFEKFVQDLHDAVLLLEFQQIEDKKTHTVSARDFGMSLVSFANLHTYPDVLDRVDSLKKNSDRFTFQEFADFQRVLKNIDDIDTAVHFYSRVGPFSKAEFKKATQAVTGIQLRDAQLDVLWFIFDKNGDGKLAAEEFYDVMKGRRSLGLSRTRNTGFTQFVSCAKDCFKSHVINREPSSD